MGDFGTYAMSCSTSQFAMQLRLRYAVTAKYDEFTARSG